MTAYSSIPIVLVYLGRMLGLCLFLPFAEISAFSPWRVMAAFFGAILLSAGHSGAAAVATFPAEILIGMLCALPFCLASEAACFFGELIDTVRGQTAAQVFDPLHSSPQSVSAMLSKNGMICAAFMAGGAPFLCEFLAESLVAFPPGQFQAIPLSVFGETSLRLISNALSGAAVLFMPLSVAALLCEAAGAIAGRAVPGLSITTDLTSLKTALFGFLLLRFFGVRSHVKRTRGPSGALVPF